MKIGFHPLIASTEVACCEFLGIIWVNKTDTAPPNPHGIYNVYGKKHK
jgi:hypothetical protein